MGLQQVETAPVVAIVGINIGVQRTCIDDESYDAASIRRISSIRSEMSSRPL
jgi:hypothetical protein